MALTASTVNRLLAKVDHYDKDERYMCLSDLTNEMSKLPTDSRIDPISERKIIQAITDRLDKDSSLDVQAIAVKCLSILVIHISDNGISDTCDKLINQVIYGRTELQDVYAIGIKTIINEVPNYDTIGYAINKPLLPKLLKDGLIKPTDNTKRNDVRIECLDISQELVRKFGDRMHNEISQLTKVYIESLLDSNPTIRKRTTAAIGIISTYLNDQLLEELINTLLSYIEKRTKSTTSTTGKVSGAEATRTIIQTIGTVSRHVRHRLGRHLQRIVPLFLDYLGSTEAAMDDESANNEIANELRENILTAFESFFGATGDVNMDTNINSNTDSTLASYRNSVINACLSWMTFDPNYFYDDDNNNDDITHDDDNNMDEDYGGDDGDFDETDDDTSWKSRRAAVRVLIGIVNSITEIPGSSVNNTLIPASAEGLHTLMEQIAVPLMKRIKEREEGVRLEIINAVTVLLTVTHVILAKLMDTTRDKQTANVSTDMDTLLIGLGNSAIPSTGLSTGTSTSSTFVGVTRQLSSSSTSAVEEAVTVTKNDIYQMIPPLIKSSLAHLRMKDAKSVKTRSSLLHLLRTIFVVLDTDGGNNSIGSGSAASIFSPYLAAIVPATLQCMRDRTQAQSAALRLEASQFLHALLLSFSKNPALLAPYYTNIINQLADSSKDDYYRIVAITMRSCSVISTLLHPVNMDNTSMQVEGTLSSSSVTFGSPVVANHNVLYKTLLQAILPRLQAHDIDQEIKDGAILASATILAHAGNITEISTHQTTILQLLNDRIKSDNTRLQVLRSLAYIANSPLQLDISSTINNILIDLSNFMRQISRPLRAQTLSSLNTFLSTQGTKLNFDGLQKICTETATVTSMNDSDLHMCHLAFELGSTIIRTFPSTQATQLLSDTILKRSIELSSSSVLQGNALDSLTQMLRNGISLNLGGSFSFSSLIPALITHATSSSTVNSRAALTSSAKCIAAVVSAGDDAVSHPFINTCLKDATTVNGAATLPSVSGKTISHPLLSRLIISETSRYMDILNFDKNVLPSLFNTLQQTNATSSSLVTTNDELQHASALAIGGIVAANMNTGLSELLSTINKADTNQVYILLQSLRETIYRHSPMTNNGPSIQPYISNITKLLLSTNFIAAKDDGVRNVVAECIGQITAADPAFMLPLIVDQILVDSPLARWTAITSIKYCVSVSGAYNVLTDTLPPYLYKLLNTIVDSDLLTRTAAFSTVNTLIHSTPLFLRKLFIPVTNNRLPIPLVVLPSVPGTTPNETAELTRPIWPQEGLLVPIYYETIPHKELIRKIFLGPFTHIVDDGLSIRKAAFTCIESLIERVPGVLQYELLPSLLAGMRDTSEDIRMLAHTSFSKACTHSIIKRLIVNDNTTNTTTSNTNNNLLDSIITLFEQNLVTNATIAPTTSTNPNTSSSLSPNPTESELLTDNARLTLRSFDKLLKTLPTGLITNNKHINELINLCEHREPIASAFATIRAEK